MDLRQLECVVAVARHEHVTRAADALHLTQSAVSQHVLRLEAELGVRLFERGARGTTPTAAGRELLERAEAILAAVGDARAAMAAHGAGTAAVVRVLAAPGEVAGLADALAATSVDVALRHAPAAEVVDGVRRGAAELGLCALDGPAPGGLDAVPLAPDPLVLLGPAVGANVAQSATRTPAGLAGLRERPVLLPAPGTAARTVAAAAFAATGFSPLPRFEVADAASAAAVVAAGLAVAVVPASWAAAHPQLRADPLPGAAPVRPVLVHRPGLSPAAATLAAALARALAP